MGRDFCVICTIPATMPISIHAPHMGRDLCNAGAVGDALNISIHAPHMGRDQNVVPDRIEILYFNPRAPYGARLLVSQSTAETMTISIHAPHMGRDSKNA